MTESRKPTARPRPFSTLELRYALRVPAKEPLRAALAPASPPESAPDARPTPAGPPPKRLRRPPAPDRSPALCDPSTRGRARVTDRTTPSVQLRPTLSAVSPPSVQRRMHPRRRLRGPLSGAGQTPGKVDRTPAGAGLTPGKVHPGLIRRWIPCGSLPGGWPARDSVPVPGTAPRTGAGRPLCASGAPPTGGYGQKRAALPLKRRAKARGHHAQRHWTEPRLTQRRQRRGG
jgi:hypothetical protein